MTASDLTAPYVALEEAAGDARRRSCPQALQMGRDLGAEPAAVGRACDESASPCATASLGVSDARRAGILVLNLRMTSG